MAEFIGITEIYPNFSALIPGENPLSDGGRWGSYSTRPPLQVSFPIAGSIHGTVEFAVNGSVYLTPFVGTTLEAYGCAPGSGLGAALESHRIVALVGDPNAYTGYSAGHGGGIGSSYFFRRYNGGSVTNWVGIAETGSPPYPEKLGIRITQTHVQQWAYYSDAWHLIHDVADTTYRGATYFALETEEQGGIEEVGWTCFGAWVRPSRTQIYRLVRGTTST